MKARWHGEAEGPYFHADEIIGFLEDIREHSANQIGPGDTTHPLLVLFDRMIGEWHRLKADATRARLHAVTNRVDPYSLANDLLALRDELADEETP